MSPALTEQFSVVFYLKSPQFPSLKATRQVRSKTRSMLNLFYFFKRFIRLYTVNSSPKVRLAELTCTITYCGAWGRTFRGNDQNSSASHLMPAQNALKMHFLLLNFLLKQTQSFLSTWTTLQIWQPHSLAHFLKIRIMLKDCCFGTLERIQCPLQKDKFKGTKIKKNSVKTVTKRMRQLIANSKI